MLGRVASAIGEAGGTIGNIVLVEASRGHVLRDITIDAGDEAHERGIVEAVRGVDGAEVVDWTDRTLGAARRRQARGPPQAPADARVDDLSMAYTPGVARVCSAIAADPDRAFQFTIKRNTVAVVSDGTAVLGLGDIGPEAAMPVMEGKAMLFKEFAGVDAFPICLDTKDPDEIVATVKAIAPGFGGINLEDISAPRCFEIEERLKAELPIPVFHDDQHGTAVVTLAARASTRASSPAGGRGRPRGDRRRRRGRHRGGEDPARGRREGRHRLRLARRDPQGPRGLRVAAPMKRWLADETNREGRAGGPADVIEGIDLFVGLSGARVMPAEALGAMAPDAMVFAMANPTPEVTPEEAAPYARVIATGPHGLPEPDQQRPLLPGHLPRRARRPRARDHRGDEDGRGRGHRRDRRRRHCARTT